VTTADGFNLFIDLELEPDAAPAVIASRIEELKYVWSKDSTGIRGNQASVKLARLSQYKALAAAPEQLEEHAKEARLQRQEERRQAVEELTHLLSMLTEQPDRARIEQFVERFKARLPADDVRKLAAKVPEKETKKRPSRPLLEKSLADRIAKDLQIVKKTDLYAFLDDPAYRVTMRSSEDVLRRAADALATKLKNKTDPQSTVSQGLVSHCRNVLCDADRRASYDNTLAIAAIRPLVRDLRLIATNNVLTRSQLDQVAARAVAAGVPREAAIEYLEDEIDKQKLTIVGDRSSIPATRVCGHDGTLIHDAATKHCTSCGRALEIDCPKCHRPVPTERAQCTCGFRVGDLPLITAWFDEGEQHVRGNRDHEAIATYERVLAVWPEWPRAVQARDLAHKRVEAARQALQAQIDTQKAAAEAEAAKADAIRAQLAAQEQAREQRVAAARHEAVQRIEARLAELAAMVKARHLCAARPCGDRADQDMSYATVEQRTRLAALRAEVETGWKEAQATFAKARAAHRAAELAATPRERAPHRDAAIAGYQATLASCADFEAALAQLGSLPPEPPLSVDASIGKGVLRVTWSEVRDATGYRVVLTKGRPPKTTVDGHFVKVPRSPWTSPALESGLPYYCAVFTERGSVVSEQARVSGPHFQAGEVERLEVSRDLDGVSLRWVLPPGGHHVEVTRRALGPNDAAVLVPARGDEARDTTAGRSEAHTYTVRAVYRDANGTEHRSAGLTARIDAVSADHPSAARWGATIKANLPPVQTGMVRQVRQRIWSPAALTAGTILVALFTWLAMAYGCGAMIHGRRASLERAPTAELQNPPGNHRPVSSLTAPPKQPGSGVETLK
jgi:hypothetical protein